MAVRGLKHTPDASVDLKLGEVWGVAVELGWHICHFNYNLKLNKNLEIQLGSKIGTTVKNCN